jgi:uncharacterized membrane protein YedE/YeeE
MDIYSSISALLGGLLIGLAVVVLILFNGRVAGISGILSGLLFGVKNERSWRLMFLIGLLISPFFYRLFATNPSLEISNHLGKIIVAGLLVGFGSRLGSGCTSGHGVCGIARLSKRSIVATLVFMFAAIVTVFLTRHVFHLA